MYFPLRATEESPRMFRSDFIDAFSRTHFSIVPLLYVPATVVLLWLGAQQPGVTWLGSLAAVAGGFVAWTFAEYWLHRTLFHWIPKAAWGERFHFFLHGVHHTWPNDRFRLVMPPAVSISLFWIVLALCLWSFESYGYTFHAGVVVGYMFYDLMHYYLHHGRPRSRMMRKLQGHHMSHHFNKRYQEKRYGVSNPFWDYVFGTAK